MTSEAATVPVDERAPAPVAKDDVHVAPESTTATPAGNTESAPKSEEPAPSAPQTKEEQESKPAVPTKDDEPAPATPAKDAAPTSTSTPLARFFQELPAIYKEADYREMWGIELSDSPETHVPTSIVATKFLRANTNDVAKAKKQLIEALQWRKKMEPLKLLESTKFDKSKFGDLGFVTTYEGTKGKEIVTWNIYGAVKENKATFGDVDE